MKAQPSFFGLLGQQPPSVIAPDVRFDGPTFVPAHDQARLSGQTARVSQLMLDGKWRTLREIADVTGDPEASISARLRDFRKRRFGGYQVERRRRGLESRGLFEYRLTEPV